MSEPYDPNAVDYPGPWPEDTAAAGQPYQPPPPFQAPPAYPGRVFGPPGQPYGPPPGQPYGAPSYPPPPGYFDAYGAPMRGGRRPWSRRQRWTVAIVVSAVLLATAGVVSAALLSPSSAPRAVPTISLPAQAAGYSEITEITGSQLGNLLPTGGGSAPSGFYRSGRVALYGPGFRQIQVIFVAASSQDIPSLAPQLTPDRQASAVSGVLADLGVTGATTQSAGPWGGVLQCGELNELITRITVCAWADRGTIGLVMMLGAPDLNTAGDTTRAFRSAAEH